MSNEEAAFGERLASNNKKGLAQLCEVRLDDAGILWFVCRGGGVADVERVLTATEAARIAATLKLTARGSEEFRRLGFEVAQNRVEVASFAAKWEGK